jgi:hypothetical protein
MLIGSLQDDDTRGDFCIERELLMEETGKNVGGD